MELMEILKSAVEKKASDIFIISGLAVTYKENGIITKQNDNMILPAEAEKLIKEIYRLAGRDISRYEETGDDDFSVSVKGLSRFRISAYKQRGSMAAVIRVVEFDIPDYKELNIPQEVITDTVARTKGLVLVTGPAGGGNVCLHRDGVRVGVRRAPPLRGGRRERESGVCRYEGR